LEIQSRDSQKSKTQILEESLIFWLKKMNKKSPKINKFEECIGVLTEMEADSWLKKTSERKNKSNKSLINFD